MFGFFRRKKPEAACAAPLPERPAAVFAPAERRSLEPDRVRTLREAALAAFDARLEESEGEPTEQQALYRSFLMTADCTEAFAFRVRKPDGGFLCVEEWTAATEDVAQEVAFALLDASNAGAAFTEDPETLVVPDVVLAGLALPHPEAAGLPPAGGESALLSTKGIPYSSSFAVEMNFVSDSRRLIRPRRTGMVLESGGRARLLSPELFIIAETLAAFAREKSGASDEEGCRFAWAKAQSVLAGSPAALQALKEKLRSRILTAARLTVETDGRGRLRPVFLKPRSLRESADDFTSILSAQEKQALMKYLESSLPLKGHIPLASRTYVFLTPEATRVVEAVRRVNKKPAAERLAFLANPQRALMESLRDDPAVAADELEEIVDNVFVETPEFLNERVRMLGPWRPKSLSFGAPAANEWFEGDEDHWGLFIDGFYFWATEEELRDLLKKAKKARAAGEEEIVFQERTVSVAAVSIPDLNRLVKEAEKRRLDGKAFEEDESDDEDGDRRKKKDGEAPQESAPVRYGPDIKDNIEQLEYAVRRTRRDAWTHALTGVCGTLMPHQEEALKWLQGLWNGGVPGALLADDMGLGKTLECIAFLVWLVEGHRRQDLRPRCLVVAPAGLVANWRAEADRWAPAALGEPLVLSGAVLRELKSLTPSDRAERLDDHVWCIATYEAVRNHFEFFLGESWTVMVLDEAQKIKNPVSMLTECVKSLETKFTLAMTGTPVENSFLDVWSILDAVVPGVMGSARDFNALWCDDARIEECGRGLHDLLCGSARMLDEAGAGGAVRLMLRRMKTDRIRELPLKRAEPLRAEMPPEQIEVYDDVMRRGRDLGAKESMRGLQLLHRLAAASLSPDDLWREGAGISNAEIARSARLTALFAILDDVRAKGEKAVVFVLHLELQRKLALAVRERYGLDHVPGMISGQMNAEKRQAVVRAFQDPKKAGEFDVVILTARAAGTGLTLTAANHVVHLERWWNPAVEDQCSDRCWRIGQKRDVVVHYPLAVLPHAGRRSYDEKLDAFLAMKRSRSENILAPTAGEGATREFIHEMLGDDK
ncbi:DEAD/DEAH box helicase [Sutterella sp.]|uniref:DEAD/DEAH box helicase n=1 Tax=Sutterella sp. TaxID=1981025 RepID=UPI003FD8F2A8